jgi:hypothetical protein
VRACMRLDPSQGLFLIAAAAARSCVSFTKKNEAVIWAHRYLLASKFWMAPCTQISLWFSQAATDCNVVPDTFNEDSSAVECLMNEMIAGTPNSTLFRSMDDDDKSTATSLSVPLFVAASVVLLIMT